MRIALLPTLFDNQYSESSHVTLILLAKELRRKGHEVYIISEGVKGLPSSETFKNVPLRRGPIFPVFSGPLIDFFKLLSRLFSPALEVRRLAKKGIKFDILHSFSSSRFFVIRAALARKFNKGGRVVHTLRGHSGYWLGNKVSSLLNLADVIIVSAKNLSKELILKGCKRDKLKIINSPINILKFKPLAKNLAKKRIDVKDKFILYYGSLIDNKGPKFLIRNMKEISAKNNLKLVILSRHEVDSDYFELVKSLNLEKEVLFIDKEIDNIEDYVNASEMVVLPYNNLISTEANPSSVLEAMASKTPLITTNIPELKEVLSEKDALLISPNNSEQLLKAIKKLLKDKKLKKRLTEHAYKTVQKFDTKKITKQFIELYEKILESS